MTTAIILAALALAANPAQEPPAAPPAPKPADTAKAVEGVTVSAARPEIQTTIDRRSYSVAADLQGQTGNIADVLRNIPSIQVDVQGNVSLRGDASVTVLLDGQPSSQFNADTLAMALQAMPADRIDRIEVITNPSAEFRADGTGGVINLVTKKAKGEGRTGSVLANVRDDGSYSGTLTGGYNSNALRLTGDVSYRHLMQDQYVDNRMGQVDPGGPFGARDVAAQMGVFDFGAGHVGAEYDLDARTRLSGDLRASYGDRNIDGVDRLQMYDASGAPTFIFDRQGAVGVTLASAQATTTWRRRYGEGHDLTLVANVNGGETRNGRFETTSIVFPAGEPPRQTKVFYHGDSRQSGLKADYNQPAPGKAKLKLGYELDVNESIATDTEGALLDPAVRNRFVMEDTRNQAYVTYERPFGDLTVLAGLRAEATSLDLDQETQGVETGQNYARLYPSLHLGYALGEGRRVTASYSRRVNRPGLVDLNPFLRSGSVQAAVKGNPDLRPEDTDSFELGFENRKGASSFLATAYYRQTTSAFTTLAFDLGDGVLLGERANAGEKRSGGVEVVKTGKLTDRLTYNLSANLYWLQIEAVDLGFNRDRSATTGYGRANLNWQVTPKDFIQVNVFANSKIVYPQGYTAPTASGNIGYRHKVNDRLSWMIVAQDPFGTFKNEVVLDLPGGLTRRNTRSNSRQYTFSLVRTFGGAKPRDPAFDFIYGGVGE